MALARALVAAARDPRHLVPQIGDRGAHRLGVFAECGGPRIHGALQDRHAPIASLPSASSVAGPARN